MKNTIHDNIVVVRNGEKIKIKKKFFYIEANNTAVLLTVTRQTELAIRVRINDSSQAIWIPKSCLKIVNDEIKTAFIGMKLHSKEFKHKLALSENNQ